MSAAVPSPEEIGRLPAAEADRLLDRLEREVPTRPPLAEIGTASGDRAFVFGDSHGDWESTADVVRRFVSAGPRGVLVGLGDYVDRSPPSLPHGSVVNALYLLGVAARWPERVFLLQGNHETVRRLGVRPRDLPREVEEMWGKDPTRLGRITALLERGSLAAWTSSGAYLAHAGFPRPPRPTPWTASFDALDDHRLEEIVWVECAASTLRRGVAPPFTQAELAEFLASSGLSVFLRGHDPDIAGKPVFERRCLTLHTTRVFERYGGILVASLPLDRPVGDLGGVTVEHLATETAGASGRD
jgi:hypothetical protein